MHDLDVTLVAVASPPGRGGVGCVRISGPDAGTIAAGLFRPVKGGAAGRPAFGRFLDRDGRAIDHGYLVEFPAEASFTGEPTSELWPHGSPAVLAALVEAAIGAGAAPAGPGEFTYRALRNGRLDLARAEAVRDLVAARTLYQARVAFAQAEGALSRRVAPLRESLADLIARGEAAVEFVDESETHLPPEGLRRGIEQAAGACEHLLDGFRHGRVVREGASLVITGLPNVGKSSLFNALLSRERAIVTEVPGTTRDTLEEHLDLGGVPVRLVDTAGLREVGDLVESEGVRRARAARQEADLEMLVLDGSRPLEAAEREALEAARGDGGSTTIVVVNKIDLPATAPPPVPDAVQVSARTGRGLDTLRAAIRKRVAGAGPVEDPILTDARHAHAVERARDALARAAKAAVEGLSEELVLEDLREAMHNLGSITGEFTTEDLYDRIFSTFCIGK
jgi:tRNA modification GTPase